MNFLLETVSPDAFYQNLLLGLPKLLQKLKKFGLKNKHLTRFLPASREQINTWEQANEVSMPEDMKNFYYSTNGFLYQWSCFCSASHVGIIGKIDINSIENLDQLTGFKKRSNPGITVGESSYLIRLGYNSKVFDMCTLENEAKVCLIYLETRYLPTVWLCTNNMKFYFLADSLTKYLSMAISHLGFPNWQMLYTPQGVPNWTSALMRIMCPGILEQNRRNKTIEMIKNFRIIEAQMNYETAEVNILDTNVFNKNFYKKTNFINLKKKDENSSWRSESPGKKKAAKGKKRYNRKAFSKTCINLRTKPIK